MAPVMIDLVSSDDEAPMREITKAAVIPAPKPNPSAAGGPQRLPMAKRSGTSVHQERIRKADTFRRKEAESTAFHKARTSATPLNYTPAIAPAAPPAVSGTERPTKRRRMGEDDEEGEVIEIATGHARQHVPVQGPTSSRNTAPFGRSEDSLQPHESDSGPDEIPARPRAQHRSMRADEHVYKQPETEQRSIAGTPYTAEDDAKIARLRKEGLKWNQLAPQFPGRNTVSLKEHWKYLKRKKRLVQQTDPAPIDVHANGPTFDDTAVADHPDEGYADHDDDEALPKGISSVAATLDTPSDVRMESSATPEVVMQDFVLSAEPNPESLVFKGSSEGFGGRYSADEDAHLIKLKEVHKISWDDMPGYFVGRTQGSLQVRYSGLRRKSSAPAAVLDLAHESSFAVDSDTMHSGDQRPRRRRKREAQPGYISWADVRTKRLVDDSQLQAVDGAQIDQASVTSDTLSQRSVQQRMQALPVGRALRARELGHTRVLKVSSDLQNSVLDMLGPQRSFNGTSGDVTCIAWSKDDNRFAAGSIAISDVSSMQYNRPYNLLLGNVERNTLLELPEHHARRPLVAETTVDTSGNRRPNVNASHEMRATQDPRVFMTVAAVDFDSSWYLFTAGGDGCVRMYDTEGGCLDTLKLDATVDMLVCCGPGLIVVAQHTAVGGIVMLQYDAGQFMNTEVLPRPQMLGSIPVFPSALKRGGPNGRLLLAGFASDGVEEERATAGGIGLWDLQTRSLLDTPSVSRGVFDVAWNLSPSSRSTLFAVAVSKPENRIRSEVQCFSWDRTGIRRTLTWDCPALDINDVVYCPHDDNLIAAGATDGKVYIWDKRYADNKQSPLHVFEHGRTTNVIDHDRPREVADTGVRFLSWSATADRLYSGSSDGVVKVWDPYRSTEDAHVKDVAQFETAVMSGAFSTDFCELLIGEEKGQINLLGIDREGRSVRTTKRFDLLTAPAQSASVPEGDVAMGGTKAAAQLQGKCDTSPSALADKIAQCTLDCGYIPTAADEDGKMSDNRASEQRIPGALREHVLPRKWSQAPNYQDITNAEVEEAGPFVCCSFCRGPATPSKGTHLICEKCTLIRSGLTHRCKRCSYPIRPDAEGGEETRLVCQRCEFACFRCAEMAEYSVQDRTVECVPCGLKWEGGVLGYELCEAGSAEHSAGTDAKRRAKPRAIDAADEVVDDTVVDLTLDRERLHRGWHSAWVDGLGSQHTSISTKASVEEYLLSDAELVLGKYHECTSAQIMMAAHPGMNATKLRKLRGILQVHNECREDVDALNAQLSKKE
ncbi:hypothetical protein B0A48_14196 [Cryoendolithus antarcticus]|uniref:Myb-like domain-containing protein n=1 Tax=Cryoendolithus antarcticus TaxID=1507870 RepID=A0A1V8SM84_9PEZI|nr:hypothetical protein B0A48_14196 [Cryoendolithus antarcticus]